MKLDIHFIRHGTTEGNLKGWYYGILDIPLAPEGVEEVKEYIDLGIYPRIEGADYYTSGLLRAEETFTLIYGEEEREIFPEFREVNFGAFEGKSHEELKGSPEYRKWIRDKTRATPPPEGESVPQFKSRVMSGLERLIKENNEKSNRTEDAVVVCHGGVIGTIMSTIFPEEREHFFWWIPDPGRGFVLATKDGTPYDFREI